MVDSKLDMNCNRLVQELGKPCEDFTKKDIVDFIKKNDIHHVNFLYP